MAGNPLASLPGLPQRPSLARSSASETRLTRPGIEAARSRKLNSAPTAAFRLTGLGITGLRPGEVVRGRILTSLLRGRPGARGGQAVQIPQVAIFGGIAKPSAFARMAHGGLREAVA